MHSKQMQEHITVPAPYAPNLSDVAARLIDFACRDPWPNDAAIVIQNMGDVNLGEGLQGAAEADLLQSDDGSPGIFACSITGAAGLVTVTQASHPYNSGDLVSISGTNGLFDTIMRVTKTGADTFTYPWILTGGPTAGFSSKTTHPVAPATPFAALSVPLVGIINPGGETEFRSSYENSPGWKKYLRLRVRSVSPNAPTELRISILSHLPLQLSIGV